MPAFADAIIIDLPRLDFPTGVEVTRGCIDPVAINGVCLPRR